MPAPLLHDPRRRAPLGVLALTLSIGLLGACSGQSPKDASKASAATPAAPRDVKTAIVHAEAWSRTLRATGELAAFEEATISTKVAGRLERIAVDLGTRVKQGDVLAAIEARDFDLRVTASKTALQAARARLGLSIEGEGNDDTLAPDDAAIVKLAVAQLDEARLARDRQTSLAKEGVTSKAAYDSAEIAFRAAESRVQDAREEVQNRRAQLSQRRAELAIAAQQLSDTQITAPFDGIVRTRLASPGDFLAAGAAVATLVRADPLRLRLEIPERDASSVYVGQSVKIAIEGDPAEHAGTLARTSPSINARSRTLLVEAEVRNESLQLRPGSFVQAQIVVDAAAQALTVPADALVSFAGIDKLLVVEGDKATERRVTVGRRDATRVEIQSGVKSGDVVVLAPGNLQTGASVRVAK
jgi:RND family efflux transporter MFP subunit